MIHSGPPPGVSQGDDGHAARGRTSSLSEQEASQCSHRRPRMYARAAAHPLFIPGSSPHDPTTAAITTA